ncbi:MAG TPA: hypothetical protein VFS15_06025 [Kofleriaceae bacterium]|nr:hypothetical protein [Kofleriaceae bacterium]
MKTLVLGTLAVLGACGPSARDEHPVDAAPGGGSDDAAVVAPPDSRVYAHSGSKLYQIDTETLVPVEIGTMAGLGTQSLTDLAIDKSDQMIGITLDKLYSIDGTTGAATLIRDLSQSARGFTSLSFVPADLNDSNSEDILVSANSSGDVFQIDPATGTATKLGSYGTVANGKVGSSGDLIAIRGLGIYATVNIGTDPAAQDYLARIDPDTWTATPLGTGTGYNDIFGLGYWAGTIYGFVAGDTTTGKIITIDPNTGAGTEVLANAIRWYGAGVATDAPILQ